MWTYSFLNAQISQKWWYLMKKEACEGADGTSGCSTTHSLRPPSNIVCLSPKKFEITWGSSNVNMWCIVSKKRERLKNDDISWKRKCVKERMARADTAQLTCVDRSLISYALQPRILRHVSLCLHAWALESMRNLEFQCRYTRRKHAAQEHPRTPACSECAYWSCYHIARLSWCWIRSRQKLKLLKPLDAWRNSVLRNNRSIQSCTACQLVSSTQLTRTRASRLTYEHQPRSDDDEVASVEGEGVT